MLSNIAHNIVRPRQWTTLKPLITVKALLQWDENTDSYKIFWLDGRMVFETTIWKEVVPNGVSEGGYSQSQNDSDKTDFETNYKNYANGKTSRADDGGRTVVAQASGAALSTGIQIGAISASSSTFQRITRAAYTEQSVNCQPSIRSSSASDAAAGSGSRTMELTYYSQDGSGPYKETVTMDGTSWVNFIATNVCFIEKLRNITQGVSDDINTMNVGTITLNNAINGGGSAIITIPVADGETYIGIHYVPPGVTCNIPRIGASRAVGNTAARLWIYKTPIPVANKSPILIADVIHVDGNHVSVPFFSPIKVQGPAKIGTWIAPTSNQATYYYVTIEYFEE
jgi:hypothetical protein